MGSKSGFFDRHYHLLRRLHSLTGIVPIGVFLIVHLITNSSLAWGAFALREGAFREGVGAGGVQYFAQEVIWINSQVPHLLLIEVTLWVSLAFHAALGFYYGLRGRENNVQRYGYQANWRYSLQRWSGYIGFVFILYHVATLRWGWTFLVPGGTRWEFAYAASTLAQSLRGSPTGEFEFLGLLVSLLYFAGIVLLVFHFANGLWTAAITWGLTVTREAQRRWGYVCAAIGFGLLGAGLAAFGGALAIDPEQARAVEEHVAERHGLEAPEAVGADDIEAAVEGR